MTQWLPWLQSSPEQKQQIKSLALRFGINVEAEGQRNVVTRSLDISYYSYNLTSYTARNALSDFQSYLRGRNFSNYYYNVDLANEIKANGLFEYTILSSLGDFDVASLIGDAKVANGINNMQGNNLLSAIEDRNKKKDQQIGLGNQGMF